MEPTPSKHRPRQFASDNYAPICPEAWSALERANRDHAPSYGNCVWTQMAADRLRQVFEFDCPVYFVFNGTAANSMALAVMCRSYHAMVCHRLAHIETDECGAPQFFSGGATILPVDAPNAKLTPEVLASAVLKRTDIHYPKPRAVSITQPTELGTLYTLGELEALRDEARRLRLFIHLDGARFANAIAAMGCSPKTLVEASGADILCLGGTKNGFAIGEAMLFFNHSLARDFDHHCKASGQLASKMRFLAAQWAGVLQNDAWLKHAANANAMAQRLEKGLASLPGVQIRYPRGANCVFVTIPPHADAAMHARGWAYYNFIADAGSRLMCAWDTQPADVDAFLADLAECLALPTQK